jgi:hypothetical protein
MPDLLSFLAPGIDLTAPDKVMANVRARSDLTVLFLRHPEIARALGRLDRHHFSLLPSFFQRTEEAGTILHLAERHNLVEHQDTRWRLKDAAAATYLTGGWLEELTALGLEAAGAEDIRCGQRVFWRAGTDGSEHMNEVDVMAIAADQPVLVSCKATATLLLHKRDGDDRLFDAMKELAYWNLHFAKGTAIPIFVTTADFYDEDRRRFRSPKLMEQARVLNLNVVPADYGSWTRFTNRLKEILKTAD